MRLDPRGTTLCRLALSALSAATILWSQAAVAKDRVALVIGNSAYQNTGALINPRNDAEDMAAALKLAGFEVIFDRDLDKRGMERSVARFARLARTADAALFYYAGHGMQHRGSNYLMPIDARLEDEFSLSFEMTRLDDVLSALQQTRGVKILVLDACRNNPLVDRLARTSPTRDFIATRGLAKLDASRGMIVAYATQADQVAIDGAGRNSPFTAALVKHMNEPGLEIGSLFRRVAADVNKATGGKQLPELSVSLLGEFHFSRADTDAQAWAKIRRSQDAAQLGDFIARYPKSPLITDARERLEAIGAAESARLERDRAEQQRRERQLAERDRLERARSEQAERELLAAGRERQAERERLAREQAERDRVAREEAARREQARLEDERRRLSQNTPPTPSSSNVQTAMLTPTAEPTPQSSLPPPLAGGALVKEIKKELKRVGCYAGPIDERWATASGSLAKFAKLAKLSPTPQQPDSGLLVTLRGKADRVCPVECGVGETETNGRCIAKACPRGQVRGGDGHCKADNKNAVAPDTRQDQRKSNAGTAGCSAFESEVRCRCAVQVGGWVSGDDFSHGGNRDAFYKCLLARGYRG